MGVLIGFTHKHCKVKGCKAVWKSNYPFCRYANFVCSIFLLRKIDMFFALLKTRYDINLVAARQHIECVNTYRVCKTYRKSRKRFISMKKRLVETSRFFWWRWGDGRFFKSALLVHPSLRLRYRTAHHSAKNSPPDCFPNASCPLRLRFPSLFLT